MIFQIKELGYSGKDFLTILTRYELPKYASTHPNDRSYILARRIQ